ncbi:MAG TPA: hypothetical protein VIX37_14570 [Candidatus Sulfotelmatobacter sp.]
MRRPAGTVRRNMAATALDVLGADAEYIRDEATVYEAPRCLQILARL